MNGDIFAEHALTEAGWLRNIRVSVDGSGRIGAVAEGDRAGAHSVGVLLPAPGNVHSHGFQRALAGLAEARGPAGSDDFWSWRDLMYRFLDELGPDEVEAIAAQAQMEMLEAGFAAVGEFHYLHHQAGGAPYDQPAELTQRLLSAAVQTGIGYTHLPVLYMRGGLDGRPLEGGQLRFGCDAERFARLHAACAESLIGCPADFCLGVAPHSLRAVSKEGLDLAVGLAKDAPIHIHIAEQTAEVEAVDEALGARPVRWLLDHAPVDARWCLVHATHMTEAESDGVAATGGVVGVCPVTEANLGDGIFDATGFAKAGGRFGIGTDSNIRISLTEELRLLEYSQRLRDRRRVLLADQDRSCGRFLYEQAARAGARALGRDAGRIAPGALADLVALDAESSLLAGLSGDRLLDAWIFSGDDRAVTDVWAAGRHMVRDGRHVRRDEIARRFAAVIRDVRAGL